MLRGWLRNRLDHLSNDTIQDMPIGQTDVRRLREGQVGCQFWSAFVPDQGGLGAREPQLETLRTTLQQIDVLHALFERHPATFGFVDTADDILPVFRSGRIASLLGIEGLHQIANSASVLRMYHRLGIRYATLCHDKSNLYCDSSVRAWTSRWSPKSLAHKEVDLSDYDACNRTPKTQQTEVSRLRVARWWPR